MDDTTLTEGGYFAWLTWCVSLVCSVMPGEWQNIRDVTFLNGSAHSLECCFSFVGDEGERHMTIHAPFGHAQNEGEHSPNTATLQHIDERRQELLFAMKQGERDEQDS